MRRDFGWERSARRYLEVYDEVLARTAPSPRVGARCLAAAAMTSLVVAGGRDGRIDPKLCPRRVRGRLVGATIGAFFDAAARRWADHDAVVAPRQGVRWTYLASWPCGSRRLAAGLVGLGLAPGERIGIWRPTSPNGGDPVRPPPRPASSWSTSTRPTA